MPGPPPPPPRYDPPGPGPSNAGDPPRPLVSPHFEAGSVPDPETLAANLKAHRELVRIARDPDADPAMAPILAHLRAAEPALRAACFAAQDAADRAATLLERVEALPMDGLDVIMAAADAGERVAAANAAWHAAFAAWSEVFRIVGAA
jgi:hypothetical protein